MKRKYKNEEWCTWGDFNSVSNKEERLGMGVNSIRSEMKEFKRFIGHLTLFDQVEAANKVIISFIKKHIGKKPMSWHTTLNQVLWACITSPKEATESTPFRLMFGHDIILPA